MEILLKINVQLLIKYNIHVVGDDSILNVSQCENPRYCRIIMGNNEKT